MFTHYIRIRKVNITEIPISTKTKWSFIRSLFYIDTFTVGIVRVTVRFAAWYVVSRILSLNLSKQKSVGL